MKHQNQQKKGKLASRKHLSADALFKGLHKDFLSISDHREGDTDISMADALMSGFAVFSLKDPSRNLSTTFGHSLKKITEDCFCPPKYSPVG